MQYRPRCPPLLNPHHLGRPAPPFDVVGCQQGIPRADAADLGRGSANHYPADSGLPNGVAAQETRFHIGVECRPRQVTASYDCVCDAFGSFAVYLKGREDLVRSVVEAKAT